MRKIEEMFDAKRQVNKEPDRDTQIIRGHNYKATQRPWYKYTPKITLRVLRSLLDRSVMPGKLEFEGFLIVPYSGGIRV